MTANVLGPDEVAAKLSRIVLTTTNVLMDIRQMDDLFPGVLESHKMVAGLMEALSEELEHWIKTPGKTIHITSAQRTAAQRIVDRSADTGEVVSEAIQKMATAKPRRK